MIRILTNGMYLFCEWVMRLAYLNVLWIFFTLLGLGVFGVMPATVAMFAVVKKWGDGNIEEPIFKQFAKVYKEEWCKSNGLFGVICMMALILYADVVISATYVHSIVASLFLSVSIVYISALLYIVPVYLHVKAGFWYMFKFCVVLAFIRPHITFFMLLSAVGFVLLGLWHITFALFFCGSGLSLVLTKLIYFPIEEKGANTYQQDVSRLS
ncbi:YesL family protein [Bacillus sp. NPDC077027]|uniref:YesL family protein n=1 Tax=Bacillus sp. NPDC077027 TaxID=3390548 RepID=UPI003D02D3A9